MAAAVVVVVVVIVIMNALMCVSPGAVVIRSEDVWPMIRIYRGGFLLIEFLFLLGTLTQTHTCLYSCYGWL